MVLTIAPSVSFLRTFLSALIHTSERFIAVPALKVIHKQQLPILLAHSRQYVFLFHICYIIGTRTTLSKSHRPNRSLK